jgi:hypothetical protein
MQTMRSHFVNNLSLLDGSSIRSSSRSFPRIFLSNFPITFLGRGNLLRFLPWRIFKVHVVLEDVKKKVIRKNEGSGRIWFLVTSGTLKSIRWHRLSVEHAARSTVLVHCNWRVFLVLLLRIWKHHVEYQFFIRVDCVVLEFLSHFKRYGSLQLKGELTR